jgi:hypothetical protein
VGKRGPNKLPLRFTPKTVLRRRRVEEASKRSKFHRIEWIDFQHGVCSDCGIMMHLIQTTELGKRGWQMKDVWGGDDNGIGGAFLEPPCRDGRDR